MTAHVCDPLTGGQGGPITLSRVLRIVLAKLDTQQGDSAVVDVLNDLAGCPVCLSACLLVMAGVAVGSMPDRGPRVVAAFDLHLAAALDQIAAGR